MNRSIQSFNLLPSLGLPSSGAVFFGVLAVICCGVVPAQDQLSPQAIQQINAIQLEKASRTRTQQKIDSALVVESKRRANAAFPAGFPGMRSGVQVDSGGRVEVDIAAVVSPSLLARIAAVGGAVVNSHPKFRAIRALLSIDQIETLAAERDVQFIERASEFMLNKDNTSQGDTAHAADDARMNNSVTGAGVRVGVLSDGVNTLAARQVTEDLPPTVTVLPGQTGSGDEGTAMLEIVHDLAPGAELYFATAFGGEAQFAQNILDLQAAGCDVIVDDVFYFAEDVFQDDVIAQAVETVTALGVSYFSSAGNSGNKNDGTSGVWEGDFVSTPVPAPLAGAGSAHDFGGGTNSNLITLDSPSRFSLQWSDPHLGSANDYDLYLLDAGLTTVLAASTSSQSGTQNPHEAITSTTENDTGLRLVVVKFSGSDRYLHLNAHRGRLSINTNGQTAGHAAAAGAFGIAAVNVAHAGTGEFDGDEPVETFSSDGPRRVFYESDGTPITAGNFLSTGGEVRNKPDFTAADGVATATPGFNPFFGTSAAAPHAAAIAALLIEEGIFTTPAAIRAQFAATALDIEAAGYDRDSGYGIIYSPAAVPVELSGFQID